MHDATQLLTLLDFANTHTHTTTLVFDQIQTFISVWHTQT